MAWIESHQSLARHPKTKRLARALGITVPTAIGHLHLLWWWALDYAQSGDITRYTPEDIADAAAWEGDPVKFSDALVDAGFVDRDGERRELHDWDDYAGKLLERRASDRERKRKSSRPPTEFRRNSNGTRTDSVVTLPTIPTEPREEEDARAREGEPEPETPMQAILAGWARGTQEAGKNPASGCLVQDLLLERADEGWPTDLLRELAREAAGKDKPRSWALAVLPNLDHANVRSLAEYRARQRKPRSRAAPAIAAADTDYPDLTERYADVLGGDPHG